MEVVQSVLCHQGCYSCTARKLLSHEARAVPVLCQYCQCPKSRGGQSTARGAVMQQQLRASLFLLLVCEDRTRGCDCSASADAKEGLNSWSSVRAGGDSSWACSALHSPPYCTLPCSSQLLGWLLAGWKGLTGSLATGQCCWECITKGLSKYSTQHPSSFFCI